MERKLEIQKLRSKSLPHCSCTSNGYGSPDPHLTLPSQKPKETSDILLM